MNGFGAFVENVGVDHGGFDILVAKQFLYGANVVAGFKQMGSERVAKRMGREPFFETRCSSGLPYCSLQCGFMDVMSYCLSCFRVSIAI